MYFSKEIYVMCHIAVDGLNEDGKLKRIFL